jgi:hypothetical protein
MDVSKNSKNKVSGGRAPEPMTTQERRASMDGLMAEEIEKELLKRKVILHAI